MAIIESSATEILIEREKPLETLRAALAGAAAGKGRLVFVAGEAGVGKTSLLRRFCADLPAGTAVFWGGCDPLATPRPLGPFLELAETAGIDAVLDPRGAPHNVAAAVLDLVQARDAVVVDRGRALGGRGLAGRPAGLRPKAPEDGVSRPRHIPRRRARGRDHPLRIALGDISTAAAVERLVAPAAHP